MDIRKLAIHLIPVVVLLLVSAVFFAPNAFNGKVLPQPDNDKARAMQTEIQQYLKEEGKAPLWTNSAFGGMPAYQIYTPIYGNFTKPIYQAVFLGTDVSSVWVQVFIAMLCMYLFLGTLQIDWRVALLGAVGYGITTYNVDILEAGHSTKMAALALAPGVFAGIMLLKRGQWLIGGGLTAVFIAIQLYANHVQITYYTLLLSGLFFLAWLVESFLQKNWMPWLKGAGVALLALILGFGANTSKLWPTYEYGQETIRGKSDLSAKASKGDGLDQDYLFGWSYGIGETFTTLIPHYAGGGAGEKYAKTKFAAAVQPEVRNQIRGFFYNGDQPFVGTAIYFGAVVVFLFFLGAFLARGAIKWWLIAGAAFMVSLAWGKNFFLNMVWYDYLPMFNKFRAVSMALGPAQWCVAALAAIGLQAFAGKDRSPDEKKRALLIAGGVSGGLILLAWMFGGGDGPNDQMLAQQNPELLKLLQEDRADMLRADALRSLALIAASFGILWFYLRGTLAAAWSVLLLVALALFDQWGICTRTLNAEKYEYKREATAPPAPQPFDNQIKQDQSIHYRVLDMARGGITSNATASYFHRSLSGYHAAKLQRFQEVVDTFLSTDLGRNLHLVGMLNGKYLINPQGTVMQNPQYYGNAWFVKHYSVLPDADAELAALRSLNPADTALVSGGHAERLRGFTLQYDSTATIALSKYHPDRMEYTYSCTSDQLAVFSEIYYPPSKGWKCYLNGEPAPDFFKVDYLLRGMKLPAGANQKLEMRFEPRSYYQGEQISRVASGLSILLLLAGLFFFFRDFKPSDPDHLHNESPKPAETSAPKSKTKDSGGKKRR